MSDRICPDCRTRYLPLRAACACRRDMLGEIMGAIAREMATTR